MKKITFLLTIFITATSIAQTNLLQNGSFELHPDGILYTSELTSANPHWYANSNPGRNIKLFINATFAQDQTNFINFGVNVNPQSLIQDFTAEENTEYTVTLWHQIWANTTTIEELYPSATVLANGEVIKNQVLDGSLPNQGDWVKTEFTFNSGNNTNLKFRVNRPVNPAPVVRFDNISIVTTASLSINDNLVDFGFRSYPNPVSNIMKVTATEIIDRMDIYNVIGKKVLSIIVKNTAKDIDVSNLPKGIYLVKAQIKDAVNTYKFIKE